MSKICQLTGKKRMFGNKKRPNAMNATKRCFLSNIHRCRYWLESEQRFITLMISAKAKRTIDKKGINVVVANLRADGAKI